MMIFFTILQLFQGNNESDKHIKAPSVQTTGVGALTLARQTWP